MNSTYDDPEVRKVYPFADVLRETLAELGGAPRDAVLRGRDARDPGRASIPPAEVDPQASFDKLKDNLQVVADGGMY